MRKKYKQFKTLRFVSKIKEKRKGFYLMAYTCLMVGSFFLLLDLRIGITPLELLDLFHLDYSVGAYTLEGLDIFADIIGAIFLFVGVFYAKNFNRK